MAAVPVRVSAALPYERERVLEVLPCVLVALSSTMMRSGGYALGLEPNLHGLALGHSLAGSLPAGDHRDAVRVRLQPVERAVKPVGERKARHVAVQSRAEHHQVLDVVRRVGARLGDYRRLDDAECRDAYHEHCGGY